MTTLWKLAKDFKLRKQPILVPRLVQQATRIMMTSSEASVAGSDVTMSPPASPPPVFLVPVHNVNPDAGETSSISSLSLSASGVAAPPDALGASTTGSNGQQAGSATAAVREQPTPVPSMVAAHPTPVDRSGTSHNLERTTSQDSFPTRPKNWLKQICAKMGALCDCAC